MVQYAKPLARLVGELEKLPGIGPKSAQRLAFYLLRLSDEVARARGGSAEARRLYRGFAWISVIRRSNS